MFKALFQSALVVTASFLFSAAAEAGTLKGRCSVAASVHGGKKFVVMKCDRSDNPGNFIIRSEAWENKDSARYKKLARYSGRRFTCDITYETTSRSGAMDVSRYQVEKCK